METDYTALVRDRLLGDHGAQDEDQVPGDVERQLQEARSRYPQATVYWDDELQDVMVDLSTGRGA